MRNFKVCITNQYGVTIGILFMMEKTIDLPEIRVSISKKPDDGKWHIPNSSMGYSGELYNLEELIEEMQVAQRLMHFLEDNYSGREFNVKTTHWIYTDMNFEKSLKDMMVIS